jgi:hypothetical protein
VLTGPELLEWTDAFFDAFNDDEFSDLLLRLDDSIRNYSNQQRVARQIIKDVVGAFSRRGNEFKLIAAATEARPSDATLVRLASGKKAAAAPDDANLQNLIRDTNSFLNFSTWLERAGTTQVCVCRIEIAAQGGDTIYGTGFLIAPELLMTNWHVLRSVIAHEDNDASYLGAKAQASDVICRFDYKELGDGSRSAGSTFSLAQDWRVVISPNNRRNQEPQTDELDCAVIKLARPAGSLPVGDPQRKSSMGDARGFISLPSSTAPGYGFSPHSPLFIVQHPAAEPIKLALETDAIQSINANRTRVRYSTNTEAGSSGSPCFDQNWNLIALHHSGDPNFVEGIAPTYNQGIPIDTIVSFLKGKITLN